MILEQVESPTGPWLESCAVTEAWQVTEGLLGGEASFQRVWPVCVRVQTRTATRVLRPRVQGGQWLRVVEATEGSVPMGLGVQRPPGVGERDFSTGQGPRLEPGQEQMGCLWEGQICKDV